MTWIWTVGMIACVIQTFLMAFWSLRRLREFSRHRLLLDFGQPRFTVAGVLGGILVGALCMYLGYDAYEDRLSTDAGYDSLALVLINLFLLVMSVADSIPRPGLYEQGICVLARHLIGRTNMFIPWESIEEYIWQVSGHWDEYRRLVINAGHVQCTCLIPAGFVAEVDSLLKEKCHAKASDSLSIGDGAKGESTIGFPVS